ncbi:Mannose-6-phosphate isomerase, class I [Streptomyces zhaozhouensis]|uniref:Mannose-6-phosphate isomerase, class I n=1 Tax=Streptomyces zhaozhouensis TaxID=1300267 RepID=A0A286DX96_9ACTN|nr:class I mannose-6-phosphate isomerase [Streptomyces zhaozhouensis]SOD63288.1 Mannose-6-phosphate isomerase, class I [Streptomyces zhaozhouensis]
MYRLDPRYSPAPTAHLVTGWRAVSERLPDATAVVALDGPPTVDWPAVVDRLTAELRAAGRAVTPRDVRERYAPPEVVRARTVPPEADDPYFPRLAEATLDALFDAPPECAPAEEGLTLVYGPGAALVAHRVLWYVDLPKRYAEAAVGAGVGAHLGLPKGEPADPRRLFYADWPMLDRHRDALVDRVDGWLDVQDPASPCWLDGEGLRATLAALARRPVRTRPYFNSTPWGGHWAQRELGFRPGARNTALGYELIAPESGVLVGEGPGREVEVPFQLLCVRHPEEMLGARAHAVFGTSFPIRFDYLDTEGGGDLSVHCHPREEAMRERFGWSYTQHETYYVTRGAPEGRVFLGVREDFDDARFRAEVTASARDGVPMRPEDHVLTFPAEPGQLYLIPAGTPHASGAGNVVLEISATPYLYSLRFYDWLRPDADGRPRPLPYRHALDNLESARRGARVAEELVPAPRRLREGPGWHEELLGALDEVFYEVRRVTLDGDAVSEDHTDGRFHVLNVVDGEGVTVVTESGDTHPLARSETLTVPAAVGGYRLRPAPGGARVVKALVR